MSQSDHQPPLEQRFRVLCAISRAQHFAWREAMQQMFPDADLSAVVNKMWEITGKQTGDSYALRIDPAQPLAPQVAASMVWSSHCMGEVAEVETSDANGATNEAFVRHSDCPWFHWHKKLGLLAEDRAGCDAWFQSTVAAVNARMGTALRVETLQSLPSGDSCCRRRFWIDPTSHA